MVVAGRGGCALWYRKLVRSRDGRKCGQWYEKGCVIMVMVKGNCALRRGRGSGAV